MLNLALASSINLVPVESLVGFVLEACRRQKPPTPGGKVITVDVGAVVWPHQIARNMATRRCLSGFSTLFFFLRLSHSIA